MWLRSGTDLLESPYIMDYTTSDYIFFYKNRSYPNTAYITGNWTKYNWHQHFVRHKRNSTRQCRVKVYFSLTFYIGWSNDWLTHFVIRTVPYHFSVHDIIQFNLNSFSSLLNPEGIEVISIKAFDTVEIYWKIQTTYTYTHSLEVCKGVDKLLMNYSTP